MKILMNNRFIKLLALQKTFKEKTSAQSLETPVPEIHLYDSQNLDTLKWPCNLEADHARRFLTPLIQNGVQHYIDNIQTEIKLLKLNEHILPITINQGEYENSYVCSPYGHFVSYPLEFLDMVDQPILKKGIRSLLYGFGKILRWGKINKVIVVNNWLFSTNLYPTLSEEIVIPITNYLKVHFPDYTIVFRSIDPYLNQDYKKVFQKNGFRMIASRQVYFTDAKNEQIFQTRIFKSDLRLLQKSDYEVVEEEHLGKEDYERILELYSALYINKYSNHNPKFNIRFIEFAIKNKALHIKVLKKNGHIDGVVGYVYRYGIMFSPFFGYDISKPQEIGLYRLLSTILMLEAKQRQAIFHQSSGASFYKKVRRAEGHLEYIAVYHKHLPYLRWAPWLLLQSISNSIGISFMKKY